MQRFKLTIGAVLVAHMAFSTQLNAEGGAILFKSNCVVCHAADGSGNTSPGKALNIKDLRSAEVQKMSDADLTGSISKGKNKMPAFGQKLNPDQLQELVNYIRTLKK